MESLTVKMSMAAFAPQGGLSLEKNMGGKFTQHISPLLILYAILFM